MLLGVIGNQAGGLAHVGGCVRPYQVSRLLPINRSSLLSLLPLCCGASIHASSTEPAGSPSHASIAAHEPGSSSGSMYRVHPTKYGFTKYHGRTSINVCMRISRTMVNDLAGLCTIVHVQDYRYRSGYITRLILSSRPHLAHDSCGPRSTRWLRKLTPIGSSLSDPAGRTGSIVRTSTATRVCSDDGKRACPRMAGGTASRLSTSCRGRRRNLR